MAAPQVQDGDGRVRGEGVRDPDAPVAAVGLVAHGLDVAPEGQNACAPGFFDQIGADLGGIALGHRAEVQGGAGVQPELAVFLMHALQAAAGQGRQPFGLGGHVIAAGGEAPEPHHGVDARVEAAAGAPAQGRDALQQFPDRLRRRDPLAAVQPEDLRALLRDGDAVFDPVHRVDDVPGQGLGMLRVVDVELHDGVHGKELRLIFRTLRRAAAQQQRQKQRDQPLFHRIASKVFSYSSKSIA